MTVVKGLSIGEYQYYNVESNTIVNDAIVSGYAACLYVLEGGSALRSEIKTSGSIIVSGGGYADSTNVNAARASMTILKHGLAENTTVQNGGTLYVSAGGSAANVNIDTTGAMIGNYTSDTYVTGTSHGKSIRYADEIASNITVYEYRGMDVASNWTAYDTTVSGYDAYQYVLEGGSAVRTEIKTSGTMIVSGGGYANSANVNATNATMKVLAYGKAENTTVQNGGKLYVSAGGSAVNVNVDKTGIMIGNYNSDTYVTGTSHGKSIRYADEITSNITVYEYRGMDVASNWTAYDTTVSGYDAYQYVLEGGSAVRTEIKTSGTMIVYSGGYADSANVNATRATMKVLAYGVAENTIVKNGGTLHISAGGSAVNVNVDKTGIMSGNYTSDTYVTGTSHGKSIRYADEIASNITVYEYRNMHVASNWTAYDTTVSGYDAYQYVLEGGSAVRTEIKTSGTMIVYSGGYADSANVNATRATMQVLAYGVAENTIVKNGGTLHISAGGSAVNVNVDKTGTMIGTYTSNTYVTGTSHGKSIKYANGITSNITVYEYRGMDVASNWTAYNTTVSGYDAYQYVLEGGSAVRTEIKTSGTMIVYSGGYANSTNVNATSATMEVRAFGVAENTTVKNGGKLYIANKAEHRGSMTISAGCQVSVSAGGIVDFTVENQKTSDGYLINNLSLVSGTPTYTITVKNDQANGTYKLAQSASSLSGSITIGNGTVDYGTITVNGDDFVHNGITYSLDNVNGNLTLTVSGNKYTSTNEGDLDANGLADTILVHTKQGYSGAWLTTGDNASIIKWANLSDVKGGTEIIGTGKLYGSADDGQDIFFTDGKSVGAWNVVDGAVTGYKAIMNVNATTNVLGLGDFNGDGATDLLLRSTSGDLGFYATDGSGWDYLIGLGTDWTIEAIGDLNGDGMDDTVVRHNAGFAGTFLTQADGTVKWKNLDTLSDDMTIVGTGDFNEDGVDDVLLQNKSNGWVGAWLVEDGSVAGFMGICKNKNTIEQIADFNGDGIDDLRVRAGADIGVLYVNGADDTTWQYFKSVGKEWDTSTSLLA